MQFYDKVTMDGLKDRGIPTFNECEHYLIKPHENTMQTIVVELKGGKYMTICIMPKEDNVDVKLHGEHKHSYFFSGTSTSTEDVTGTHAFYNMAGDYNKK